MSDHPGSGGWGARLTMWLQNLGCDWHTVNNEVGRWGEALLQADTSRVGQVEV